MSYSLFGLRETLDGTGIDTLPKDSRVAFSVLLKCDSCSICRPHRITIRSSNRELPRRFRSIESIDPDVRLFAFVNFKCDALAIGRNSWGCILPRGNFEGLDSALLIH